ncbi:MAG: hypothetical protein AAF348_19640, partial [Bacteroidota bacterium]
NEKNYFFHFDIKKAVLYSTALLLNVENTGVEPVTSCLPGIQSGKFLNPFFCLTHYISAV